MSRWIRTLVLFFIIGAPVVLPDHDTATATPLGVTCPGVTDNPLLNPTLGKGGFIRSDTGQNFCDWFYTSQSAIANYPPHAAYNDYFFFDISTHDTDGWGLNFGFGANHTNILVGGVSVPNTFNIPTDTAGSVSKYIQFDWGGDTFYFLLEKVAGTNSISAFTVMAGPTPTLGLSESELLDEQQSFFTPLIVNHQTYNMISGVSGNLDGLFNGNGQAFSVSQSGFMFQSAGYAQKKKALEAKHSNDGLTALVYQSTSDDVLSAEQHNSLNAAERDDTYEAEADQSLDEGAPLSPWNFWVKGSWTLYDSHESSSFDGHLIDVVGGVDYRLSDDLIVGVLGGYGAADFDTLLAGTAGSFESKGMHVGVYMGKRLAPNLMFDALVAYTASDYDNVSGTTIGAFDAGRITVAAHLKGNVDWAGVIVEPTIGLMYASEKQDAYTDNNTTVHAARTVTAGRLSVGPKFIFPKVTTDNGTSQFWFAAKGEYDFSNQDTSAASGLPDIGDVASGRVQAGIASASDSGVNLSLQGDVSGLGSREFIAYGGTFKLGITF